ncbi:MAG: MCE family protein [Epsilonproteobacteria bacterium]|nr:MCE family protein [Campylobacterota bacterium]
MEKRLSYIVVGLFVIVLTLSAFSFLYWLAKYGEEAVAHDYYHVYFTESVSGLSQESAVKYKGVEVGRVKQISINKKNSEEVELLLEIESKTPIKVDTYAVLDTQGITGLKYVELKGGNRNSALLVSKKDEIATIKSKKSVMATLFDNSEVIAKKINGVLDKISAVLSKENIQNFSAITTNLSDTTAYIDKNKQKIGQILEQISELKKSIETNLNIITSDVTSFAKSGKVFVSNAKVFEDTLIPSFNKLGSMSDRAGNASDATRVFFENMQKELKNGQFNFADIVEQNLGALNETLLSIRKLSLKLDQTVSELKESPSDLLYKSHKKIPGPGESHE